MFNYSSSPLSQENIASLTDEILDSLLETEETEPWDPTAPDTEVYLSKIEAEFSLIDAFDEAEITEQADTFFSALHQSWKSVDHSYSTNDLVRQFSQVMPKDLLEIMMVQAKQLVSQNISQLNQLVECVQPLWTNWTEEDLQVFARPLAHAMRGETKVRQEAWDDLSEIEQIRFTMTIAKEMLEKLSSQEAQ